MGKCEHLHSFVLPSTARQVNICVVFMFIFYLETPFGQKVMLRSEFIPCTFNIDLHVSGNLLCAEKFYKYMVLLHTTLLEIKKLLGSTFFCFKQSDSYILSTAQTGFLLFSKDLFTIYWPLKIISPVSITCEHSKCTQLVSVDTCMIPFT